MCLLHFHSSNSISQVETNTVAAPDQQGESSFAEYHFIWGRTLLSWTDADGICRSIGMQLATIANEDEYDIVRGLLWGQGYRAGTILNEDWITTPCRLELAVCLVFLGLQLTQVGVSYFTVKLNS